MVIVNKSNIVITCDNDSSKHENNNDNTMTSTYMTFVTLPLVPRFWLIPKWSQMVLILQRNGLVLWMLILQLRILCQQIYLIWTFFWIAEGGEGNFWKETGKNKKEISKKKSSDRKGQITQNVVSQKDQNTSSDDWGRWHFVQHWCDCTDGEPEPGVFMRCLSIWYLTFRAMFGACHKPAAFP